MIDTNLAGNRVNHALQPLLTLGRGISQRMAALQKRRNFKSLLDLDDRMLSDMGVHRYEVDYASRLPLSVDAATELRRISLERRKRKM